MKALSHRPEALPETQLTRFLASRKVDDKSVTVSTCRVFILCTCIGDTSSLQWQWLDETSNLSISSWMESTVVLCSELAVSESPAWDVTVACVVDAWKMDSIFCRNSFHNSRSSASSCSCCNSICLQTKTHHTMYTVTAAAAAAAFYLPPTQVNVPHLHSTRQAGTPFTYTRGLLGFTDNGVYWVWEWKDIKKFKSGTQISYSTRNLCHFYTKKGQSLGGRHTFTVWVPEALRR